MRFVFLILLFFPLSSYSSYEGVSYFEEAIILYKNKNVNESIEMMEKSAFLDFRAAQFQLGGYYYLADDIRKAKK